MGIIVTVVYKMRNCVRVARQTLTLFVWVQILVPQPTPPVLGIQGPAGFSMLWNRGGKPAVVRVLSGSCYMRALLKASIKRKATAKRINSLVTVFQVAIGTGRIVSAY